MRKIISALYLFCTVCCVSPLVAQVTFIANDATISCEAASFCVEIEVSNFDSITGIQFSYEWDPGIITLNSQNDMLPSGFGLFFADPACPGTIGYSWFASDPLPIPYLNLPDGFVIAELCFVPNTTGTSTLDFGPICNSSMEISGLVNGTSEVIPAVYTPGTIEIQDIENPMIVCPSDTMIVSSGTNVYDIAPVSATDNCDLQSVTYSFSGATSGSGSNDASGDFFNEGTTTVTYTATDGAGNSSNCSFDVILTAPPISDTILQFIPCVNIDCENGTVSIDVKVTNFDSMTGMQWGMRWDTLILDFQNVQNFLPPAPGYNSGIENGAILFTWFSFSSPTTTLPDSTIIFTLNFDLLGTYNSPGISFEDFSMAIPILVGNVNGNMTQGVDFEFLPETVNIIDNTPPVIITPCPSNITQSIDAGQCDAVVSWIPPTFTDNCGIDTITSSHTPGDTFPVGNTMVTYTATDIGGNITTCSFTITIDDQESPIINCPADITAGTDAGVCTNSTLNIGMATATDNCGIANISNNAPAVFLAGITTVIWTASDVNGNTATCSQDIEITDNENPTLTCPPDVTFCSSGSVVLGNPVTSDNCGVASTTNNAPGSYPNGNTTVTWTVTDLTGNTATCDQIVTIEDLVPPTITCPTDVTACTSASVVLGTPVTNDNCGVASVTNNAPGSYPIGNTTVTWTVTDIAGNTATCDQLVTIDFEPPMITCPADVTACTPGPVAIGTPTTSDNCGIASTTNNAPGTFPIGITTVTWTVTDLAGNMATCDQIVTIEDLVPPTITCPTDVTACTSASVVLGTPVTNDNCGVASVTNNAPGSYPIGNTTVTWTVTDIAGNTATCDQLVTIDFEPPMITCPADVTACTPGPVAIGTPTTSDNCGIASTTNNAPGTFPIGITTVTWTVTDLAGNMATCDQLVTVDFEPPMIICPPDLTECSSDMVVLGTPTTSDNCGVASVTNNAPGTYPNGTTIVTWTAIDLAGNVATCDQSVTIGDSAPPSITCPTVDAFDADPDMCSVVVNNNLAPIVSDCNPFTVVYTITGATTGSGNNDATGTEFFVGQSLLTYYATDDLGNVDSCSILIQVNDGQNPVINCPSDVNIFVPSGTVDTIVNNIGANASDNCAVNGITYNTTGVLTVSGNGDISGTAFPPGITNITYTVSDVNGNIDSCSFMVNVSIVVNDMIGCPGNQNVANDPDLCSAVVNGIAPTILINPGLVDNIQYTLTGATTGSGSDDASGISFNVGTTTVEYILTDNSNNMDTCTFEVAVFDNQNPVWSSCPGNINASATIDGCRAIVNWPIPLPGDNCNLAQIITSHNPNDTFNIGTTIVTYVAIDSAGNVGSCSFIVSVMDNIPPTFTCPSDISIGTDAGLCTGTATWNPISVTDNCDLSPTVSCDSNSGDSFPVGVTTVTCTAVDISGNTATCTFNVFVADTEPPIVNGCPPNLTINTDQNTCEAIFSWTEPTFIDLCSNPVSVSSTHSPGQTFQVGTTTIFYIGVDAAGNSATCSFNLTVVDNEDPVISSCPDPITVASMVKECGNVVSWLPPFATDNCDNTVALIPDIPSGSFFPVGITTVTYTAIDNSGNISQCSFDVTVEDITPPDFSCFENIVIGIDGTVVSDNSGAIVSITPNAGCDSILIDYLDPPVTDNCDIDSFGVISGLPSGTVFPIGTTSITYLAIDASGNSAACVFDIIVLPLPAIMVTINPSDTVCEGQDITLMTDVTTAGATFSWENLNSGWTDTLEQPVISDITLADTGTYSVTVTYPSGCTAVGSAVLAVSEACEVFVSSNAPLCSREDLEFFTDVDTSCNVLSYSWIGPGFTSNMQNPVIPDATPANSGTYIVTVEFEGGCSVTESIAVEINLLSAPTINSSCGSDICFGSGCLLSGTQFNPTPDAYIWSATPLAGSGLIDTDNNETTVNPTLPGIYIYNYSVEIDGCISDIATMVLTVHGEPDAVVDIFGIDYETTTEIDVIANDTFTTNLGVTVSVLSGPTDGTIINNNDGTFSYTPDIGFLGTDQFVYQICYDCEADLCATATVTLEVDDDGVCVIPTLITPNNDGVNDEVFINCLESGDYPNNELVILNQWGHQVFRAAPYQNNWFGTYEGNDLPDGTYYYIFKLDDNSEVSKGALTIFR